MGKFTAHRDPAIDHTVEAHLARIVVTLSPWYRGRFAALSRQLTEELGIEVSYRDLREAWVNFCYN